MTDVTWGEVHVGDLVRGSDGRVYRVVEREQGPTWTLTGRHDRYVVERDGQQIKIVRRVTDPAPVIERSDTSYEASAVDALMRGGMTVEIGSERMTEAATTEATEAPQASGGSRCNHPEGKLSRLQNGRIKCTACGRHPRVSAWPHVQAFMSGAAESGHQESPYGQAIASKRQESAPLPPAPRVDQFTAPATVTPSGEPKRDRFGRYLLPHPETGVEQAWTRVSTVARALADEFHLSQWSQRMVAKGIALRRDLLAAAAAADLDDRDTLNSIVAQAKDAATARAGANLGTALHSFTARLDAGERLDELGAPAPLDDDLRAYAELMRDRHLTIVHSERVVVLPQYGIAGRFDRLVAQPPGVAKAAPIAVLDLKTAKDLSYSWLEIAIQLSCYANASHMWDGTTGRYVAVPPDIDRTRGLVVHLPVGKAQATLYAVDLIKGWEFAQLAIAARSARSAAKSLAWLVEPDSPADVVRLHVARATTLDELLSITDSARRRGVWTDELAALATARYDVIRAETAAGQPELASLWEELHPAGRWTDEVNAAAARRWEELNAQPQPATV